MNIKVRKDLLVMSLIFLLFSIYQQFVNIGFILRLQSSTIFEPYLLGLIFSCLFVYLMLRGHKFAVWILGISLIIISIYQLYVLLFVGQQLVEILRNSFFLLFFIYYLYCIFFGIYIITTRNKNRS